MRSLERKHINQGNSLAKTPTGIARKKQPELNLFNKFLPLPWFLWPPEGRLILALVVFWSIAGVFILGSASWWVSSKEMGDGSYLVKRQLLWLIASWSICWLTISIKLKTWLKISKLFLLIGLALVISTLFFGSTINGSSRWLILGPISFQPSELIKPFVILQGANLFGQWKRLEASQKFFWLGIFALLIISILGQPNLSTAALTGILLWMIALAAGIEYKYLFSIACSGLFFGMLSILSNEYQKLRVSSFLNPWNDPEHSGYQLIQSLLAIGSGGLFGEGFGLSTQKLLYLPFISTDFIFAVFAEEFGFVGCLMLISFYILFAFLGLRVSLMCKNNYSKLIAVGCTILLIGQSILHLAVTSGSIPTTGLPLPMISYGGNSLLASLIISGLLIRCAIESSDNFENIQTKKKLVHKKSA